MARRRKKKGAPQIELPMDSIEDASLVVEAQRRYLNYALSVITSRALPDVRDGLAGVRFIEATVRSNAQDGALVEV